MLTFLTQGILAMVQLHIWTFKLAQSLENKYLCVQDSLQSKHSSTPARPPASLMAAEEAECRNKRISRCGRGSRTHTGTHGACENLEICGNTAGDVGGGVETRVTTVVTPGVLLG